MPLAVRTSLSVLWLVLLLQSASPASGIRTTVTDSQILVENDLLLRSFPVPREAGSRIPVGGLVEKKSGTNLLIRDGDTPWFECSVNGSILTNRQRVWVFTGHQRRTMRHGGEEICLNYLVDRGPAGGLRVTHRLQMYPGSGVLRERLEFRGTEGHDLRMTKDRGRGLLIFPSYVFRPAFRLTMREIQLADWGGVAIERQTARESYDEREEEAGTRIGRNLAANYMYHPRRTDWASVPPTPGDHKGPVLVCADSVRSLGFFVAYEHGSPDGDAQQNYLAIHRTQEKDGLHLSVRALAGSYIDGDRLVPDRPLSTVWTELGVFRGRGVDAGESVLREFLLKWICEYPSARAPLFYYNTWGMQREKSMKGGDPREFLTTKTLLEDVGYAADIGVDLFVLDDGWQDMMGDWFTNTAQLPQGLEPLRRALADRRMTMGIWIAPLAADSLSRTVREHPDWLIRGDDGLAPTGRWNKKMFCFVSSYREHFVSVCKRLMDSGVRYFKWDGIDKSLCASPLHDHGDSTVSVTDRRERYGFEIIRAVTETVAELRRHNPDVDVEFDVTEPLRNVGLAFLSEGRYFWLNNGASAYGDMSQYRAKSTRMIPTLWNDLFAPALQTYANYPHNSPVYKSQRYNVLSSLAAGYGFWGDLSLMTAEDRRRVAGMVFLARRGWPRVPQVKTEILGRVGSSPEIYTTIDRSAGVGQVIAFSAAPLRYRHVITGVGSRAVLALLRNAFTTSGDSLIIPFVFPMSDAAREVFLVPCGESAVSIRSSTSWLSEAAVDSSGNLVFTSAVPGRQVIEWRRTGAAPVVTGSRRVESRITPVPNSGYRIETRTFEPATELRIAGGSL